MSTSADVRTFGDSSRVLKEGYGPGAWHGPDLKAALADIGPDLAFRRLPPGARTPERLGYGRAHLRDLARRGIRIRRVRIG